MTLDMTTRTPAGSATTRPPRPAERTIRITRIDFMWIPSLEGVELIRWAAGEDHFEWAEAHTRIDGGLDILIWESS